MVSTPMTPSITATRRTSKAEVAPSADRVGSKAAYSRIKALKHSVVQQDSRSRHVVAQATLMARTVQRTCSHASATDSKISKSSITPAATRAATTGPRTPVRHNEISHSPASDEARTRASMPAPSIDATPESWSVSSAGNRDSSSAIIRCSAGTASPHRQPRTWITFLPVTNRCTLMVAGSGSRTLPHQAHSLQELCPPVHSCGRLPTDSRAPRAQQRITAGDDGGPVCLFDTDWRWQ